MGGEQLVEVFNESAHLFAQCVIVECGTGRVGFVHLVEQSVGFVAESLAHEVYDVILIVFVFGKAAALGQQQGSCLAHHARVIV